MRPNPFLSRGRPTARSPDKEAAPQLPQPLVRHAPALSNQALSYTLIQLRPHPSMQQRQAEAEAGEDTRPTMSRWFLVYIPAVLLFAAVAYVLCELAMKQLAVRSVHHQLASLPAQPPVMPQAMLPPAALQPTPANQGHQAFPAASSMAGGLALHSYNGSEGSLL